MVTNWIKKMQITIQTSYNHINIFVKKIIFLIFSITYLLDIKYSYNLEAINLEINNRNVYSLLNLYNYLFI